MIAIPNRLCKMNEAQQQCCQATKNMQQSHNVASKNIVRETLRSYRSIEEQKLFSNGNY